MHQRERGPIEVPSRTQCPCALYDGKVFVDGMGVRKDDISRVLMDSQDKRLPGFREIPPDLFYPLALLELVQRYNGVMGRRTLRQGATEQNEYNRQQER